ncbi:MAG TPA: MFS transporter [Methylomirabilota bacterium]|nr:MFS transporter [Methylomirabilota bacterium]
MELLRPSVVLGSLARLASTLSITQPGEVLPAASPALAGAPPPDGAAARAVPAKPLRRSLAAAVAEGACAEVFAACATGAVITGWALYLGAGTALIGFLAALPLVAQLASLPAAWFISGRSRKWATVVAVCVSRLTFLPLIALPWLGLAPAAKLRVFVAIVAVSTIFGVIGNSAWVAWMGDLVPGRLRGRYFGQRTVVLSMAGTLASLAAALTLDRVGPLGWTGAALSVLTAVACLAGLASLGLLLRQHEPAGAREADAAAGWMSLRAALADRRVRPYLHYQLAWNAAVGISASFFAYHLLANLHTGFLVVAAHGVVVAVVRIASARLWGRAVDRIGARPVLIVCSFGIAAVPAIWLFPTPERLWPIAIEAVLSGFLWGGHGIAALDLTIGLAPRTGRPFYLAAFATAGGLGFGVASVLAGQLATLAPAHFTLGGMEWTSIHILFLLSSLGRLAGGGLAVRLQDPGARGGVPDLVRSLSAPLRAAVAESFVPELARIPVFARRHR